MVDINLIYSLIFGGVVIGSLYALIAVGMTLLFAAASMVNLAHGEFLMVGAYVTYWLLVLFGIAPLLSLILVALLAAGLGFLIYIGAFSRLYARALSRGELETTTLLLTFALIIIMTNAAAGLWTPDFRAYEYLTGILEFHDMRAMQSRLLVPALAIPMILILHFITKKTWFGKGVLCVIEDKAVAQLVGINPNRVYLYCYTFGLATAGMAGVLYSMNWLITPFIGIEYTMAAFVVIILGGVGSIPGALVGGLLLALLESTLVYMLAPILKIAIMYSVLIIVLLVRPRGIFGRK